ncbi:hypothetical protein, partial [Neisseria meningitidis]|uniref:hypothetical protein n=3 Tax=Neisseria meningitidis TaxID=487 RepID=UPI00046DAFA4
INKNQDKATKPQTVQIVRQGEATLYWFLLIHYKVLRTIPNPSFATAAAISAIIHASAILPPT